MKIAKNKVVEIEYTLTDPKGEVIDTSKGRGPMTYMQGVGNLIPGLESQLEGRSAGESLVAIVPADKAYGEKDDELVQKVSRGAFKGVDDIKPGMQFQANSPDGHARVVTVVAVTDQEVTVDANHPLAGMELKFDVKVISVRDATEEELDHGHAHGPGEHHHH